ncbi:MAG: hypothetical protein MHPSP_001618, partial [Paramarteilia canceri]
RSVNNGNSQLIQASKKLQRIIAEISFHQSEDTKFFEFINTTKSNKEWANKFEYLAQILNGHLYSGANSTVLSDNELQIVFRLIDKSDFKNFELDI